MNSGQAMPIPPGEFNIGRLEEAYVRVDDPSVSRTHARLLNGDEGLFIEDLGSSNGTAFRGAFIATRTKLNLGDIVYVGSVPFRIDPEVSGPGGNQTSALPALTSIKPGSLTRATERLPVMGEPARVVEAIAPDKLSAPEVNPADNEADELNAVVLREAAPNPLPTPGAAAPVAAPQAVVQAQPAPTALPKAKPHSVRIAVSVPGPQQSLNVARYPEPKVEAKVVPKVAAATATTVSGPRVPTPLTPQAPLSPTTSTSGNKIVADKGWETKLVPFLVGLGAGIGLGFTLAWFVLKAH